MPVTDEITMVDERMAGLEGIDATDRESAIQAFSHLVVTADQINKALVEAGSERGLVDDIFEKLSEWVEKLVPKAEKIALTIGENTSISVAIGPVVTLTFPSFKDMTEHPSSG